MLRLATFNAGLAVGVLPHVTERLPHVLSALAGLDVDVLFVQEFWLDEHWDQLVSRVHARLPHGLRPEAAGARRGSCSAEQLRGLRACAEHHCAGLRDEALARCVVQHCAPLALALPRDCLNCIASNPMGTLEEIFERCTGARAASSPTSLPDGGNGPHGGLIAYGGSFGTGLLLRSEPQRTSTIAFPASLNARGALWAELKAGELGTVHVFAAHLSPGGREQAPQVDRLLAWIDEKAGSAPAVLLGDLNTTPGADLFRRFERAGFRAGASGSSISTFSSEGLLSGYFGESGLRLDHVLVRGNLAVHSKRILDQRVLLESGTVPSTLSDHAGLLATVSRPS